MLAEQNYNKTIRNLIWFFTNLVFFARLSSSGDHNGRKVSSSCRSCQCTSCGAAKVFFVYHLFGCDLPCKNNRGKKKRYPNGVMMSWSSTGRQKNKNKKNTQGCYTTSNCVGADSECCRSIVRWLYLLEFDKRFDMTGDLSRCLFALRGQSVSQGSAFWMVLTSAASRVLGV